MSVTRFSPDFIELCLKTDIKPGDKLPCPRCGKQDTHYRDPALYKKIGAVGVVLAGILALVLRDLTVRITLMLVAGLFFAFTLTLEPSYRCSYCQFQWRARDALKWAKAIRHDEESKVRRSGGDTPQA